ncbi:MAG: hypothetical protein CM1200mP30_19660 [Pseudomonadota bacterium]|nr:MAG: hypothetical protein CM1200mP30_19660 [Pseudomonadota bacterium]
MTFAVYNCGWVWFIGPKRNFACDELWMDDECRNRSFTFSNISYFSPVLLMQMPKIMPNTSFESRFALTKIFADITERHGRIILIISICALQECYGAARLNVENSFIDYFQEDTEIYQGMKVIDQKLGGTTPLDLIVQLEKSELKHRRKKRKAQMLKNWKMKKSLIPLKKNLRNQPVKHNTGSLQRKWSKLKKFMITSTD